MAICALVVVLITSNHFRQGQKHDTRTMGDFYQRTKSAIDKGRHVGGGSGRQKPMGKNKDTEVGDEEDDAVARALASRLKLAEQKAKDSANAKVPNKPDAPDAIVGVGSSASGQGKKSKEVQKGKSGEEDAEVEGEINTILKKSPGTSCSIASHVVSATDLFASHYLLQVILPLLEEGEAHPPRQVPDPTHSTRRRARPTPLGQAHSRPAGCHDRQEDGAKRHDLRHQHRWWRRHCLPRRGQEAWRKDHGDWREARRCQGALEPRWLVAFTLA